MIYIYIFILLYTPLHSPNSTSLPSTLHSSPLPSPNSYFLHSILSVLDNDKTHGNKKKHKSKSHKRFNRPSNLPDIEFEGKMVPGLCSVSSSKQEVEKKPKGELQEDDILRSLLQKTGF